jgi:hypothetical protein
MTTFDHPLENLALREETIIPWVTLKASLDPEIKSDILQWGDPILYDSLSVEIRPMLSNNHANSTTRFGTYYCALFHRKLLFFLPHPSPLPTDSSPYRLVGAVNVQQDLKDIRLLADPAVKPLAYRRGGPPPITGLEFRTFLGPLRLEHRVSLECGQGIFGSEDKFSKWAEMLGVVKRFSIATRDPGPRHSFIFSPVELLPCIS